MTYILMFALQINPECLSQWYLSKYRKCHEVSSPSNKWACFNFFDAGLTLTNRAWVEERQMKEIVTQGSGQKGPCLQLTLKREQKLELPQGLLSKYQPFRSGHQTESIPRRREYFLFLNKGEIKILFSILTFRLDKKECCSFN